MLAHPTCQPSIAKKRAAAGRRREWAPQGVFPHLVICVASLVCHSGIRNPLSAI